MKCKTVFFLLASFCLSFEALAVPNIYVDTHSIEESHELTDEEYMLNRERFSEHVPQEILFSDLSFTTATRSVQNIREVTDNVVVITRKEIERWPVSDLDEALGFVNGIVIQDDGHLGQVATAQIYGSQTREVRVMVDGITFNSTTTGGLADISQIPLEIVEKIEIIKGASSSVWGSSMGGVINIITRSVGTQWMPEIQGDFGWGEFRTNRYRGNARGALGIFRYYISGSYVSSGGFRPHGDSLEKRSYFKGELEVSKNITLLGSFGYSGSKISEFELPNAGGGVRGQRKVLSRYGQFGLRITPVEKNLLEIFYKISERSFRRDTIALPGGIAAMFFGGPGTFLRHSKARSIIHEVSLRNVWDFADNQTLVLGSDIGVDLYSDTVFAAPFPPGGPMTTNLNVNKKNTRHAYYSNYQLSIWRVDLTLGTRIDLTNSYGSEFNPSAGFVFHLPFWDSHLKANVSKAFNAPSLVDRFQTVGTLLANSDLRAERAIVYNVGLESKPFTWLYMQSVFFQTFVEDSIQTITRSDGFRQRVNLDDERRTGFESNINLGPWHGFTTSYGVTYVKAVSPGDGPVQSRPRLTQDIKVNFEKKIMQFHLNGHLAGRYMDLVTGYGLTDPIDQTFVFDGKVVLKLPAIKHFQVSLYLEGENLFNEDFSFDAANDPNPQRNFEAGFKFTVA